MTEWKLFLCGICMDCRCRLSDWILKKPNPRTLSIPTGFDLGTLTGDDVPGQKCACHICFMAGLFGGKLKAYLAGLTKPAAGDEGPDVRRCNSCFGKVSKEQPHRACVGTKETLLNNLKAALPLETRQQLALATLRETRELQGGGAGDSVIHLQSHRGGKKTEITFGRQKNTFGSSVSGVNKRQYDTRIDDDDDVFRSFEPYNNFKLPIL